MTEYKISLISPTFQKNIKELKKKYKKVTNDLEEAFEELEKNPRLGNKIPAMNLPVWKLRIKNSSTNVGKRKGFRLIYKWEEGEQIIYPILMYSKAEKATATNQEILKALELV